jgi:PAS domain S-box-containing protein
MNILVVDDDPISRLLLREVLSGKGFTISEAGDGVEALDQLQSHAVDGIVSDIMMPRMDGYRLCHEVRTGRRCQNVPFIFYSASYTSPDDQKLAMDMGADRFVNKSEPPTALVDALRTISLLPRRTRDPAAAPQELDLMKEYNERLVAKLEETNTELVMQMKAVQESESRLRTIITTDPECVKIVSPEGRLLEMNPAGLAMLEADTLEEAQSQPLLEFIVPEHRAAFIELHQRVMRGASRMLEFEITGLKGTRRWLETHAVPLRDNAGSVQSLLSITRDITKRKRAETALRESESYKRAILDSALDSIVALDHAGRIIEFNPAAERTFGYTRGEVLGQDMAQLMIPPGLREQHRRGLERLLAGGEGRVLGQRLELTALRKDGTEFPAELTITRMGDTQPPMFTGFIRDISERKQSEQSLAAAERQFRRLVEQSLVGIYIIQDARFVYVNPKVPEIFGVTRETMLERPIASFIHPDDRERVAENLRQRLEGLVASLRYEVRVLHESGAVRTLEVHGSRTEHQGRAAVTGMMLDVTERKDLEKQLRQAQKMDAVGTLAGGIAHDFNNILGAINGYTELAKLDAAEIPSVVEYLDEVSKAGSRAADLVRQILTFSRQQEQARRPLQLRHVVGEAFKLLRATIPSTIQFNLDLSGNTPMILGDATQVHQIVMNLGTNAGHAMRDRTGCLDAKLDAFEVDEDLAAMQPELRPGRYARLSISDTGHGMDRATQERIFEPFFTTKAPGEGTGLGLSVVHGIMKAHDGCITVYSEPGEGTLFHLYFPALTQEEGEAEAESTRVPSGHGERIFFLDDEEALVRLGQKMLERLGYQVETETNPVTALSTIGANVRAYDLVIADLTMPRMTGMDFARRLLQLRPDLPIILVTGYNANLSVAKVQASGLRDLLLKPLSRLALGEAVQRALHAGRINHPVTS